jgi:polygalacturonase
MAMDYGAVGDGKTLNTTALQKAIDACAAAGGGTVEIPAGRFLTGPLTLGSSMNLQVDRNATLLLSDDPALYPVTNKRFQDCLSAKGAHDVAVTGGGTIDGQGAFWWGHYVKSGPHRPFLLVLTGCRRVLIRDITLTNSPMFHLVPQKCQDVRIENIHIVAPDTAKNTDGLDPSGWNFLITGCTFNVGDDCIAIKPSGRIDPDQPSCRDFLITNCTFAHGHGLSIGGQTPGGLDGLTVRDCTFEGTDAGIRLKASRGAGGAVENLTYENLTMKGVKNAIDITSYYKGNSPGEGKIDAAQDTAQPVTATTPAWRHIHITNVTASGGRSAGRMIGLPEMPLSDITLTNVTLSARDGLQIVHAQDVRFINSRVTVTHGAPVLLEDAKVTGLGPGETTASARGAAGITAVAASPR